MYIQRPEEFKNLKSRMRDGGKNIIAMVEEACMEIEKKNKALYDLCKVDETIIREMWATTEQ